MTGRSPRPIRRAAVIAALTLAVLAGAGWLILERARARWGRGIGIREITRRIVRKLAVRLRRLPPGTVYVPGGRVALTIPGLDHLEPIELDDFFIDRCEVTNGEFKAFVDAGGYRQSRWWKHSILRDGRVVSLVEALDSFQDATGRAGPATWAHGTFPEGQERFPVSGVSWYEAAAYAAYAGKTLPTIYDWNRAADTRTSAEVVPFSNFSGRGPVAVGSLPGVTAFGASDMAGNVKEWCWNEADGSRRYILGGGWNEPQSMFIEPDARFPWERAATFGFRCVQYFSAAGAGEKALRRIPYAVRDYRRESQASEEQFRAYRALYEYSPSPLHAAVEKIDQTTGAWTRRRITFDAAYDRDRMAAYLYLPRNASPPYQTVVYFPPSDAISLREVEETLGRFAGLVPGSGRALLFPIYKGTYQRRDGLEADFPAPTRFYSDHVIAWGKDLRRSIDFVWSRSDLDHDRLAYLGFSWGAAIAPVLVAIEDRLRTAILVSGGLPFQSPSPEVDPINFVSRVKIPVLMLNGRYDHFFPVETSQRPLFRMLGSPENGKRHVIYETGHVPPAGEVTRECVAWLDMYLGPVARR